MKNSKNLLAALLLAGSYCLQAQNLQNGLQACYPLDCNADNLAQPGAILNGVTSNVTCTTGVGNVANTAYNFSGATNSYIQLPNNSLIKPNAVSFSGWVKFDVNNQSHTIVFAKNVCSAFYEGYSLGAGLSGGNFRLSVAKSGSGCWFTSQYVITGGTNLSAGVWYHVGFYAGSDSLKLYLNGLPEGSPIAAPTAMSYESSGSGQYVYLGGTNTTPNAPLDGSLDNVRFYNRKLTNAEFKLLYTSNPNCAINGEPQLTDSLQACYPLDCNVQNFAATGAALDGITMSNVTCATGHLGVANTALAFGGVSNSYVQLPNDVRIKPTTAISFAGWVKFDVNNTLQFICFAKNSCGAYYEGYALAANVTGSNYRLAVVKSSAACSPSTQHVINGVTNLSAGVWYHVGFYAGTDSIKMFLNGSPEGTPIVSTTAFNYQNTGSSQYVYLGGTNTTPNGPLDGTLDNIRFYNRKLSNFEFAKLYNSDPPCTAAGPGLLNGLQACYPLNCNAINFAPATAGVPPSLDGTLSNVQCDTGHVGDLYGSYKFAGLANSYISFPNDPRIKPTNAISVSLWAKLDALYNYQYLVFAKNTCGAWFEGYHLSANAVSGQIQYQVVKSSGSTPGCGTQGVLTSTSLYNPYTWHHIVFFMDNTIIKLYVDGVAAGSVSSSVLLNYDNTNVYLGGTNQSFNYPLNGSIDNVRIYNRELVSSDIAHIRLYDPTCDAQYGCGGNPSNCREAAITGVEGLSIEGNKISFYPNPSSGKIYVTNAKNTSMLIYDVNGKQVQHQVSQVSEVVSEVNLSGNAPGLYFVKVMDAAGNQIQTGKIILTN